MAGIAPAYSGFADHRVSYFATWPLTDFILFFFFLQLPSPPKADEGGLKKFISSASPKFLLFCLLFRFLFLPRKLFWG